MNQTGQSVMLAAGGTGGHLFPAFALAEELEQRGIIVDLVTDDRGDRYGTGFPARDIYQVPSATISSKSPVGLVRTAYKLSSGIKAAYELLREVKPSAVIGFGGYPSFPPVLAARLHGIPTAVHEQNAILGRANRMLAGRVNLIATSFDETHYIEGANSTKVRLTGNPVRKAVLDFTARAYWQPIGDDAQINILVFGGSQGARFFGDVVPPAIGLLPDEMRRRVCILQQARDEDIDRVRAAYADLNVDAQVESFFSQLPDAMTESHLVIGRAGASTVAELTVIGRPALLVPLPHSLDNDQLQNALKLSKAGAAWCIEQKDLTPERLAQELHSLIEAPQRLLDAANAAVMLGRPEAAERLADVVTELAGDVTVSPAA